MNSNKKLKQKSNTLVDIITNTFLLSCLVIGLFIIGIIIKFLMKVYFKI